MWAPGVETLESRAMMASPTIGTVTMTSVRAKFSGKFILARMFTDQGFASNVIKTNNPLT